jgi:murein DD-endopeptidase MepM/ murein hydrolase activator NlpD
MKIAWKPKHKFKYIAIFTLLAVAASVFYFADPGARSASVDDLNAQKQSVQQKLNDVNNKIKGYQDQIAQVQKDANTLTNQIKLLDLQLVATQAQIEATSDKIDAANLEIADVTNQIIVTQDNISKQKDILRNLISEINDMDQRSPLEIALENDNFTDFLNDLQYTSSIQERSQEALTQIKKLEADLEARQAELKSQKAQLVTLNNQLNDQKASLDTQRAGKQALLNETKGKEKNYQNLLSQSAAAEKELNDEINKLDDEIARQLGNNKINPKKGTLAWPMDGTISQGYGNTGFTSLGYSFHNGLDIVAAPGTPIYAAADGTIAGTGLSGKGGIDGGYGNWVAIRHESGPFASHAIISLYGHMASFVVRSGQKVKEGDLVGFEGNTGNTTRILYGPHRGFHLHFTVFDAKGFTIVPGAYQSKYGAYQVPAGAPYNPLSFLN